MFTKADLKRGLAVAVVGSALASGALLAAGSAQAAAAQTAFPDVPASSPFATAIDTLATQGVITGFPDGTFRPTTAVSRQAFASFLAKELKLSSGTCTTPSTFTDVPDSSPFCAAIQALANDGIIKGYDSATLPIFRPASLVSREALAAFLYRADGVLSKRGTTDAATTITKFSDVPKTDPFSGDINLVVAAGIAAGYSDGTFRPSAPTSRQASASFLYKFALHEKLT